MLQILRSFILYNFITIATVNVICQFLFFVYMYCFRFESFEQIMLIIMDCTCYNYLTSILLAAFLYWIKFKNKNNFNLDNELVSSNIKSIAIGIIITAYLVNNCFVTPSIRLTKNVISIELSIVSLLIIVLSYTGYGNILNYIFGIIISLVLFYTYYEICDTIHFYTWLEIESIIVEKIILLTSFRYIAEQLSIWLSTE